MTTGNKPAIFIHGLWLHSTSWSPWLDLFRDAGYQPVAPGWPNEPPTVAEAREHPELVANVGIDDVTSHMAKIIGDLDGDPVIVGHSFGGLIAEKLLGEGHGVGAVAIDPAQIKGVLPLPLAQLRARFASPWQPRQSPQSSLADEQGVSVRLWKCAYPRGVRRAVRTLDHPVSRQAVVRGCRRQLLCAFPGKGRYQEQ